MTDQTLEATDPAAPTPAPIDGAVEAPEGRAPNHRTAWIIAAVVVVVLIIAGTYASASLHKRETGIFAPETVPLAVADAQAAAAKAKAAATSARRSAIAATASKTAPARP